MLFRSKFNLLLHLGFTAKEIEEANKHICGFMTVEGAPHLREEHLAVFDTANKNGNYGKRFIHPMGHLNVMAAAQPFISGAISKTVNFPHEATDTDIQACYNHGWKSGLKAIALYRDGCKMSQPLSSKSGDSNTGDIVRKLSENSIVLNSIDELTQEQVLQAAQHLIKKSTDTKFKRELSRIVEKKKLPDKRTGFTQKAKISGQTIFVRTGEYSDHTLGEIFIDMHKEGASFRSMLNSFAIAISIGLQYGVPLEEYVDKFTFTRFEPSGPVAHPNIKSATSIIDYVFRLLGFEYLNRVDLVQVKPEIKEKLVEKVPGKPGPGKSSVNYQELAPVAEANPASDTNGTQEIAQNEQQSYYSNMMGDAPPCDICGHITVRNGNCYKCTNCGNSLGCS